MRADGAVVSIEKLYDKNRSINLSNLNLNLKKKLSVREKIEKKITNNYTFHMKKRWITEIFIDFDKT